LFNKLKTKRKSVAILAQAILAQAHPVAPAASRRFLVAMAIGAVIGVATSRR
jgi:capsular polysaccharide biosynthesis protein